MVLERRKVRVREDKWEFGSAAWRDLQLCVATTAALKIEFKSVKFELLLLFCAAIKEKEKKNVILQKLNFIFEWLLKNFFCCFKKKREYLWRNNFPGRVTTWKIFFI